MLIDIISLFPEFFSGTFDVSIIKKAKDKGLLKIRNVNLRDFGEGKHKKVDDRPFGGGPGMILMAKPIVDAISSVYCAGSRVIYLSPQGETLCSKVAKRLSEEKHLIIICGHYEGIDERIVEHFVDEEISIGDYVMTSGCPAAVVLTDTISRLVPGVVGNEQSIKCESFQDDDNIFDYPNYTFPRNFHNHLVPEILLTGNHKNIDNWRRKKSQEKAKKMGKMK